MCQYSHQNLINKRKCYFDKALCAWLYNNTALTVILYEWSLKTGPPIILAAYIIVLHVSVHVEIATAVTVSMATRSYHVRTSADNIHGV